MTETARLLAIGTPLALLALGGAIWLWLRYGMGLYLDAVLGAIAGCF